MQMSSEVLVRKATSEDVLGMASIRALYWESPAFWMQRIGGYLAGSYSPQQALALRCSFVAVHGLQVAGFVAGHHSLRLECDGELQWLDVAPEWRRRGIAAQLLGAMLGWFAANAMHRICVNVEPANEAARALYSKFGAAPFGDFWMIWDDVRLRTLF